MSDKFRQERAANVTKPGEKSLDPDLLQSGQDYPAPPKGDLKIEQSQSSAGSQGGAKDQRARNVTKPGEKPVDSDGATGGTHLSERERNVLKPGEKPIETENIPAKTDGAQDQRAANLTKPGERPIDFDGSEASAGIGSQSEDGTGGISSYKPVEWGEQYLILLMICRPLLMQRRRFEEAFKVVRAVIYEPVLHAVCICKKGTETSPMTQVVLSARLRFPSFSIQTVLATPIPTGRRQSARRLP